MNWRVCNDRGLNVATFRFAEDAAAFVAILGDGAKVVFGRKVVWKEGGEDLSASESYDGAAEIMRERAR